MVKVLLMPHHKKYAEVMSSLSSIPQVKDALGLSNNQTSIEGTIDFT